MFLSIYKHNRLNKLYIEFTKTYQQKPGIEYAHRILLGYPGLINTKPSLLNLKLWYVLRDIPCN